MSPLWGVPYTTAAGAGEEEGVGTCPNVRRLVGGQEEQASYDLDQLNLLTKVLQEVKSPAPPPLTPLTR